MSVTPKFRATILGCGSSGGVPRFGGEAEMGNWGACDPSNPNNRRRRCSLLVERFGEQGVTRVLVDTGPDMRQQLLDARTSLVDAVVFTHDHADHTNGVDDLRQMFLIRRERVRAWADAETAATLRRRFDYVFERLPGSDYPSVVELAEISEAQIDGDEAFIVNGLGGQIPIRPFRVVHGRVPALGFRFGALSEGGLAYLPDVNAIPEPVWPTLRALDIWVLDALRYTTHPSHVNVETALAWIARAAPKRAVLTNMHVDLDYATLNAATPPNVEPAFDGMQMRF
jgi:phosphoribosyl 1,2-cyclic phosphate phosphodiesterase